jgi:hypothetical protein
MKRATERGRILVGRFPSMSTPTSPGTPGSPSSGTTRQLLDELDTLMQRMLALPVGEEDGAASARADEPTLLPAASRAGTAPPRPAPASVPKPLAATLPPNLAPAAATTSPRSARAKQKLPALKETPPPAEEQVPEPLLVAPGPAPLGPEIFATLKTGPALLVPRPTVPARPGARRLLLTRGRLLGPIRWVNRAFDRGTERLGAPGRWLRGRHGRTVLGWTGVVLLLAALTWQVLVWLGWGG